MLPPFCNHIVEYENSYPLKSITSFTFIEIILRPIILKLASLLIEKAAQMQPFLIYNFNC
jgi:hypothetical protein